MTLVSHFCMLVSWVATKRPPNKRGRAYKYKYMTKIRESLMGGRELREANWVRKSLLGHFDSLGAPQHNIWHPFNKYIL